MIAWEYALAILIALGLIVAGLIALTMLWITLTEWHFWYKKWQSRRYQGEQE